MLWSVVLVLEACAVVLLLVLARRVTADASGASAAWSRVTEHLRPALVALRADAERTRAALEALQRRSADDPRR